MSRLSVLAVALVAATLAVAAAQPSTLGTRFEGFTFVSNVMGYVNMTADYCDIKAAVNTGNFTAALNLYLNGKNSFSGLARRTFYRLATVTPGPNESEPIHDALAMGRNSTWLDALIKDAAAKGNGTLLLGLLQIAGLKYAFHEMDEAYNKVVEYNKNRTANAALLDPITGAPHSVDEVWALMAGGSPSACASILGWGAYLGAEMNTTFLNRSHIVPALTLEVNELLAMSLVGNATAYNTTRYNLQRLLAVLGLQGVAFQSFRLQAALGCNQTTIAKEAREAVAVHWTYLQPILLARRVSATNVNALQTALTAWKPHYSKSVLPAIRNVISPLGIRVQDLGSPSFERVTQGWTRCRSSVMSRRLLGVLAW